MYLQTFEVFKTCSHINAVPWYPQSPNKRFDCTLIILPESFHALAKAALKDLLIAMFDIEQVLFPCEIHTWQSTELEQNI